jgi:ornithine cyclodeaminase
MKIFDARATAQGLPYGALIPALRHMFIQGCVVPRRHIHLVNEREHAPDTLLLMPAWQEGRYLGVKHVTIFPGNSARGLPGLHSTYTLYDANDGRPLAMLDGDQITARRTAAASALAADYLARKNAARLLIAGAGKVAGDLAPAYAAVRPIETDSVWNRTPRAAEALAGRLREAGFDARAAPSLQDAASSADIISCATLAREPIIRRAWLKPGVHLDLIGSFQPGMRETDDATFAGTSVFIDTAEALDKAGDLLSPIRQGLFEVGRVLATLEDLCRGRHAGRASENEITVYKAVGTALEDLAAAMLVYQDSNG